MSEILVERQDGIAILTLNRPERRNALSLSLMRELIGHLDTIATDRRTSVILIAATGGVFSSGHDLRELRDRSEEDYRAIFDTCACLMDRLQRLPQPVIAEVDGMATAAGCQLVATCDLALASERARFATPGVRIGLFCSTPMVALSRAIGRKRAMEMLLTGAAIDAKTAADWGLINRVVPSDQLRQETLALARQIASASGYTVQLGKQAYYRQIDLPQPEAYTYVKEVMTENVMAADAQEGICAFLEKRQAVWTTPEEK